MNNKTVYIIFKTHLDIGFTNLSEAIVSGYMNDYIPRAIKTGYELKDTETPFIWTVGSWLIDRALKSDKADIVEKAIEDNIITWHGLPFTTHTEIMSEKLFDYGLNVSKKLDERFGRETIGAKMTDVPGHTRGIVPHLAAAGIKFLHIGVNPVTPMPPVPELFRWKCGDDSVIVMYQKDYGEIAEFEDFVVCFAHTGDNLGPQDKDSVLKIYKEMRQRFPGYEVKASDLNEVASRICEVKDIPVLENEIGDVWIHGVGTDPEKLSRYKRLIRKIEDVDLKNIDLTDNLLLVPEHTWGGNVKRHFDDVTHFTHTEMEQVKEERKFIEKSWLEQRAYVESAERLLNAEPEYPVSEPDLTGYEKTDVASVDFEISWELYDNSDYERYKRDYLRYLKEEDVWWALWDNTKVGLPDYDGGIFTANICEAYKKGDSIIYKMCFEKNVEEKYGLPYFYVEEIADEICIKWFNKKPSRLPQAFWLKLRGYDENWELDKLGQWISPFEIVGSPLICAVNKGIRNKEIEIEMLDSSLVAPFGRKLLQYANRGGSQDLYFNLYNNIWNTNFPMWYEDDAMFRFNIKKR